LFFYVLLVLSILLIAQTAHDQLLLFVMDTEVVSVCHKDEAPEVHMTSWKVRV